MLLTHIKLVKKFKKIKNHHKSSILLKDIEIVLAPNKISSGEKKTRSTLLVTCIMIIIMI